MTVRGSHQFFKKKRVKYKHFSSIATFVASLPADQTVYLDLLGSYFVIIRQYFMQGRRAALLGYLTSLFQDYPSLVIVMDGARSSQKLATAQSRMDRSQTNLNRLVEWVDRVGDGAVIRRRWWKRTDELFKSSFLIREEDMEYLQQGLLRNNISVV